jgi:hypothetical protein
MQRRDNLLASAKELRDQLAAAQADCAEAVEELEKIQAIADRDHANDRAADVAAGDGTRSASAFAR